MRKYLASALLAVVGFAFAGAVTADNSPHPVPPKFSDNSPHPVPPKFTDNSPHPVPPK